MFARHGGSGSPCSWIDLDGVTAGLPDVLPGTPRQSEQWIFLEGVPVFPPPFPADLGIADVIESKGPIDQAFRVFTVYCHVAGFENELGTVVVTARDPFWGLNARVDDLINRLQLPRPEVATTPPGDWPGFVVRNPRPLQIADPPWATFTSTETWRGWTLALAAQPAGLRFDVDATDRDGGSSSTSITCASPVPGGGLVPATPALPDFAEPSTPLGCAFVPARRGETTITATVTYHVTFWVNGFTEALPDYPFASAPARFTVGEIHAVNQDPRP